MLQLNEKNIDKRLAGASKKTVVLFYANWCPFCRRFKPLFESYGGRPGAEFAEAEVNEDENPMWDKFKVEVVPTLVAFKEGKEIARKDGIAGIGLNENDLKSILEKISA